MAFAHSPFQVPYVSTQDEALGNNNNEDQLQRQLQVVNRDNQILRACNQTLAAALEEQRNYLIQCEKALKRIQDNLDELNVADDDPYQFKKHLKDFLEGSRLELSLLKLNHGEGTQYLPQCKHLAKSARLVHKMLENATSPRPNLDVLANDYNKLEKYAYKLEQGRADERARGKHLFIVAGCITLLAVAACITTAVFGLGPVALAFGVTALVSLRFALEGDQTRKDNYQRGIPYSLTMFGKAATQLRVHKVEHPGLCGNTRQRCR